MLWESGVATSLGNLGGSTTIPIAINDAGQVVGTSCTAGGGGAFLWERGTTTNLGSPVGVGNTATSIKAAGQIVGFAPSFVVEHGVMRDLGAE